MKTTIHLFSSLAVAALNLVSCQAPPPPDDYPVETTVVRRRYVEPAPRQETPEDFRAVTPPSSYSRKD